jgi:hypothetical protein
LEKKQFNQEEQYKKNQTVWRKALTSRFCMRYPVLVKKMAKVAGELAFSRKVWYYRTLSIEEQSEISCKWKISF